MFSSLDVFQETSQVQVSNVRTHSSNDYVAGPVRLGETYYTDRSYIITGLPDFLHGLEGVQTPNNDKHSDPADLQWLCFDVSQRAAVYVHDALRGRYQSRVNWAVAEESRIQARDIAEI